MTAQRESLPSTRTPTNRLRQDPTARVQRERTVRDQIRDRRVGARVPSSKERTPRAGVERVGGSGLRERPALESRLRDYDRRARRAGRDFGSPLRDDRVSRLRRPRVVFRDRPDMIRHAPHHVHIYRDRHHHLCHRIIWPRYHYPVYYSWGPYSAWRYVYPYYHRKYVFVSLGGYWPVGYSHVRYYWYGWHPYAWYGYYPVAQQVPNDTYNYYTYNYYTTDGGSVDQTAYTDHTTFADVRERLAQQNQQPAQQTLADTRFEEGVKSFESGDYGTAATKFAAAMKLAPDDVILPFAYAQALFADGQYSAAAGALREALKTVSPEKEGVFYPRGLYPNDEVLFGQIETLLDRVERYDYDGDLQLLLGYHLLGVGETDYARGPLEQASKDMENAEAAGALMQLLEKMEAEAASTEASATPQTSAGAADVATVQPDGQKKAGVLRRLSDNAGAADAIAATPETTSANPGLVQKEATVEAGGKTEPKSAGVVLPTTQQRATKEED